MALPSLLNPKPFLRELIGKGEVIVKLKWGMEYRGKSHNRENGESTQADPAFTTRRSAGIGGPVLQHPGEPSTNRPCPPASCPTSSFPQLLGTEEWIDGVKAGDLGEVLIR